MGTRGMIHLRARGKLYSIWNQWDSFFDVLGLNLIQAILQAIRSGRWEGWKDGFLPLEARDSRPYDHHKNSDLEYIVYQAGKEQFETYGEDLHRQTEYEYLIDLDDNTFSWLTQGYFQTVPVTEATMSALETVFSVSKKRWYRDLLNP